MAEAMLPLPAASRPSNTMATRWPVSHRPFLQGQKLAAQDTQLGAVRQVFDAPEGGDIVHGRRSFGQYSVIFQLFYVVRNHQKITAEPGCREGTTKVSGRVSANAVSGTYRKK